ncbi:MAG: ParB/RepB/Spo0J family partition protein [Bacteriovoracaceae bacterium]|jgi:ParB family chromosome partitioning protein|nr:ParB/RepB/Spo0J family partition protein [Bacteriovoracaceae bacterium]
MSKETVKTSALGKGMSALLGNSSAPLNALNVDNSSIGKTNESNGFIMVPIGAVKANKEQPRKIFKDKEIAELSASIKENGIIQPLVVAAPENGKYLLISGERRLRASRLAGLDMVPVVIKKVTKKDHMAMAIIENVQRSDLNCVEEALAYFQLMNEFSLTQEEVAKKIGKDRSTIANFLRILKLPREVVKMVQKDELSFGHAKVLVAVKNDESIKRFALETVQNKLSVRELEKLIKSKKTLKATPKSNKFFDEKMDMLKQKLEKKTGYHFDVKTKNNGSGTITIKFNNEGELNDVYEYLMK